MIAKETIHIYISLNRRRIAYTRVDKFLINFNVHFHSICTKRKKERKKDGGRGWYREDDERLVKNEKD